MADPELTLYHNDEYQETDIDMEVAVVVDEDTVTAPPADDHLGFRTLPGCELAAALVFEGPFGWLSARSKPCSAGSAFTVTSRPTPLSPAISPARTHAESPLGQYPVIQFAGTRSFGCPEDRHKGVRHEETQRILYFNPCISLCFFVPLCLCGCFLPFSPNLPLDSDTVSGFMVSRR